jgi:hypothetical protein
MMEEIEEYLFEIGELDHSPIDGPRAGHVGENVYAFQWQQLHVRERDANVHKPPNYLLASMLSSVTNRITQRHASVAASAITFLGCNCGQSIVLQAKAMASKNLNYPDALLASWTLTNKRSAGINRGLRTIEVMLAPPNYWGTDVLSGALQLQRVPDLSIEDYETVEHVYAWLGGDTGIQLVRRCEAMIEMRQRMTTRQTIEAITFGKKT